MCGGRRIFSLKIDRNFDLSEMARPLLKESAEVEAGTNRPWLRRTLNPFTSLADQSHLEALHQFQPVPLARHTVSPDDRDEPNESEPHDGEPEHGNVTIFGAG